MVIFLWLSQLILNKPLCIRRQFYQRIHHNSSSILFSHLFYLAKWENINLKFYSTANTHVVKVNAVKNPTCNSEMFIESAIHLVVELGNSYQLPSYC